MSRRLRIGTWNIAAARKLRSKAHFDYLSEDVNYFAEQLRKAELDVVCIQESHINKEDSLAQRLGAAAAMTNFSETPGCPSHIDRDYNLNIAILSNKPFDNTKIVKLPKATFELKLNGKTVPAYGRFMQTVQVAGVTIANMHTEPLGALGSSYEQGEGLEFASQIDQALTRELQRPLVFAADFNIENPGMSLSRLVKTLDLKEALSQDEPTKPHGNHPDHILYSPEFEVLDCGIVKTQTDHYLCWVEVQYAE